MMRGFTVFGSTPSSSGLAAILRSMASRVNSSCGIGPMMP
jgi:hypothetical protein